MKLEKNAEIKGNYKKYLKCQTLYKNYYYY